MPAPSASRLETSARQLATGAAAVLADLFRRPRTITHKGAIDLVTDADLASERHLQQALATLHPDHAILAEEGGARGPSNAPVTWVMDPLDGTTNYAHGFPHFCVSVAAVASDGTVLAGAVTDVMRQETFSAALGGGAFIHRKGADPERLHVSACPSLAVSLVATGFPYDRAQHADSNHAEHDALSLVTQGVRRPGAAALDLAWTAAGRLDGYWEAHLKPWDVSAGALLVSEAGGTVTGYDGSPFHWTQHHVVVGGPTLRPLLREALAKARREHGFKPVPR